jgi:hypothetical protein
MKTLNKDWLTEKTLDFEYKKYLLLAYLQSVSDDFEQHKIYPALSDLFEHYKNLVLIKENANQIEELFSKNIKQIDWQNFKIIYESQLKKDGVIEELEQLINFSIPQVKQHLDDGKRLYHHLERFLHIEPLGVIPLRQNEGYFFVRVQTQNNTHVYRYNITIFDQPEEKYRAISASFVCSYTLSITNSYDTIKHELIKNNTQLPNPATFIIESETAMPFNESLLPLAKRALLKYTASFIS